MSPPRHPPRHSLSQAAACSHFWRGALQSPEWAPCRDSGRGRGAQKEGRGQGPSKARLVGARLSVPRSPQPVTEEELAVQGGCGSARVPRPGSAHQTVSRLSHEDLPSQAGAPHSWGKSPHLYRISWGPALAEGLILPNSLTVPSIYEDGESRGGDFGGGCPQPPGGLSGSQERLTAQEPRASGSPTRGRRGCRPDLPAWVLGSA